MDDNARCLDMISGLPDFILHQILSLLPAKEAAKTCVLSKRWCHIWKTFPIVDCSQLLFGKYLDLLNPKELRLPKDVRRNIFNQRVQFMNFIDEKLGLIFENDRFLKKFSVVMTLVSVGLFPRVDAWMDLVIGLNVEELELRLILGKERYYHLPMRVLASQSLTTLSLKGRILIECLCRDDIKLSSLVELHLLGCFIDEEAILNLVSSILSMEVLSMRDCLGFTKLDLHGHNKLKKVVYHPHKDLNINNFSINLPHLEELNLGYFCVTKTRPAFISDLVSPNLKRLSLCSVSINVTTVRNIVSSFPLLEFLSLSGCVVKEAVKLSSSILKELYLQSCSFVERAEFDTPGLLLFKYYSKDMSPLSLASVADDRIAEFLVSVRDMDRSWFNKLNNFLRNNRFQELILNISVGTNYEIPSSTENFSREQLPHPFELKSVKLVMHAFSRIEYEALLDGLFWNLQPKTLIFELNNYSPAYVKGLLKSLVEGAEAKCCQAVCEENLKCWRHSLKGIKVGNVKGIKAGTPLDLCALNSLNNILDSWAIETQRILYSYGTVIEVILSFDLSWQN